MAMVEGCDGRGSEALGERNHRSVSEPQREIQVLIDKLRHPLQVGWVQCPDHQLSIGQRATEGKLSFGPESVPNQRGGFRNSEHRHEKRTARISEQFGALAVIRVQGIGGCIERTAVDDQQRRLFRHPAASGQDGTVGPGPDLCLSAAGKPAGNSGGRVDEQQVELALPGLAEMKPGSLEGAPDPMDHDLIAMGGGGLSRALP